MMLYVVVIIVVSFSFCNNIVDARFRGTLQYKRIIKTALLIKELSTIIGVTGNGGYKLGVNALITTMNLRDTIIQEHKRTQRENREKGREIDCSGLLLASVMSPRSFYS